MPTWLQQEWCLSFVLALGHFLWQGTLIAVLLAIALRATKKVSARYWLSLAALLVMAACPIVTLGWLMWPASHVAVLAPPLALEEPAPSQPMSSDAPHNDADNVGYVSNVPVNPPVTPIAPPDVVPSSTIPPPAPVDDRTWWQEFAPHLTTAYLCGVALMLLRLVVGLWGGRRLRRRVHLIDDSALLDAMRRQATALGLKLLPVLAYCERVTVPTVVGVLKPMILLPVTLASGLSPEQIESVLAHELAHLRRYDHLVNLLQRVIESLLFAHPAVWWVSHRIRDEREHCCDDLVVACGAMPLDYAKSLLRVAELSRAPRLGRSIAAVSLLVTGDKPSNLRQRIARLLGESATPALRISPRVLTLSAAVVLAGLVILLQSVASNDQSASSNDDDTKPPPLEFRIAITEEERMTDDVAWFPIIKPNLPPPAGKSGLDLPIEAKHDDQWRGLLWDNSKVALLADGTWKVVKSDIVKAAHSTDAAPRFDIHLTLDAEGGALMRRLTAAHLTQKMAILVDGKIVAAPVLRSEIGESCVITGDFSKASAEKLATAIRRPYRGKPSSEKKATKISAKLPNGIEVELAGVAMANVSYPDQSQRRKADGWWRADGTRLPAPPMKLFSAWVDESQKDFREFAIKLTPAGDATSITANYVTWTPSPPRGSSGLGGWDSSDGEPGFLKLQHTAGFNDEKQVAVHVFVSDQPFGPAWLIDVNGLALPQKPADAKTESLRKLIQIIGIEKADNETIFRSERLPADLDQRLEFNLRAIDQQDQPHQSSESRGSEAGEGRVFKLAAADIKHFEIRLRPMTQKITFENVSLVPGEMTNVNVKVEAVDPLAPKQPAVGPKPELGLGRENDRMEWSHDSRLLFANGSTAKFARWERKDAGWSAASVDKSRSANSIAVSRKSPLVVVGTNLGTVEVWDGAALVKQSLIKIGPEHSIYAVAISPDEKLIANCGTDGTVHLYDRATTKRIALLGTRAETFMASLAFDPDGKSLAALDRFGQLNLWSVPEGRLLANWRLIETNEHSSIQWSSDGKRLATNAWGRVTFIDAVKGSTPRMVKAPEAVRPKFPEDNGALITSQIGGPDGEMFLGATALSPDFRTVASVAPDASIAIWDVSSGQILKTLPAPPDNVVPRDSWGNGFHHLVFSPNGQRLACSTVRGDVIFWQLAQADERAENETAVGLEFLKPYPKLHGLSLDMTEPQFLEIVKQQELKTRKTVESQTAEGEKVTHHLSLGDGHTLIVMFDKAAKCSGIQRVRGEDLRDEEGGVAHPESSKGVGEKDGDKTSTPFAKPQGVPPDPARLRVHDARGSKALFNDVVKATVGFPKASPDVWLRSPNREGMVSLDGLPVGTQWLLAAGNSPQRLPFQITIPTEQPLLERRLRDPAWLGKKVELAVQPVVEVAEPAGEVIVIEILNRSHELLSFSEADLVLSCELPSEKVRGREWIRGLSPKWLTADREPFPQTKIEAGQTGRMRLNWREWVRQGLWSSRNHETIAEPGFPPNEPGKIWVKAGLGNGGSLPVSVTDPKAILPKEVVENVPDADAETSLPKGLEFLKPYPKLHGLSLDMTEPQFLEIVKQQELKTKKAVESKKDEGEGEKVTHHILLGDGHTLIVMFGKDAKCSGIQRVRGEGADRPLGDERTGTRELKTEPVTYVWRVVETGSGAPIEGAKVIVRRSIPVELQTTDDPPEEGMDRIALTTEHTTDADGHYAVVFTPLQVADSRLEVKVEVSHPNYVRTISNLGGMTLEEIRQTVARADRPTFAEMKLAPGNSITGVVVGPDGVVVSRAELYVVSHAPGERDSDISRVWTNKEGRFRKLVATPGDAVLWVLTENYAPLSVLVPESRGDLGTLKLARGFRLRGRVLDQDGKPLRLWSVELDREGHSPEFDAALEKTNAASGYDRWARTDENGVFELPPIEAGSYLLRVVNHNRGGVDGHCFPLRKVELSEATPPIELRPVPMVQIHVRNIDSAGRPMTVWCWACADIRWGEIDTFINSDDPTDDSSDGQNVIRIPRGSKNVKLSFESNGDHSFRYRRSPKDELKQLGLLELGDVTTDITGIEVVWYATPSVLVKVVGPDKQPLRDAVVKASYIKTAKDADPPPSEFNFDIQSHQQADGRWRVYQLLPEEDITITATNPGWTAKPQKVRFREGEEREVIVVMKPDGNARADLEFLKPYPKLHGLSLDMTEPQFLVIVKRQELKTRKTVEGEKVTHHIGLGDGHSLIVMFDKDGKCNGIQRVRGEDGSRSTRSQAEAGNESFDEQAARRELAGKEADLKKLLAEVAKAREGGSDTSRLDIDIAMARVRVAKIQLALAEAGNRREPRSSSDEQLQKLKRETLVRWGSSKNGVQVGVERVALKDSFEVGEPVVFQHRVRNTKVEEQRITLRFVANDKVSSVLHSANRFVVNALGPVTKSFTTTLAPGADTIIEGATFQIESKGMIPDRFHLESYLRFVLNDAEKASDQIDVRPPAWTQMPSDLDLTFDVVAPPSKDPATPRPSFVLQGGPDIFWRSPLQGLQAGLRYKRALKHPQQLQHSDNWIWKMDDTVQAEFIVRNVLPTPNSITYRVTEDDKLVELDPSAGSLTAYDNYSAVQPWRNKTGVARTEGHAPANRERTKVLEPGEMLVIASQEFQLVQRPAANDKDWSKLPKVNCFLVEDGGLYRLRTRMGVRGTIASPISLETGNARLWLRDAHPQPEVVRATANANNVGAGQGRLTLGYDMPGAASQATIVIKPLDGKNETLRRTIKNGAQPDDVSLAPGRYTVAREMTLKVGQQQAVIECQRQVVEVAVGKVTTVEFSQSGDKRVAPKGQWKMLREHAVAGAFLTVHPVAKGQMDASNPDAYIDYEAVRETITATTCGPDGVFQIEPLPEGRYVTILRAFTGSTNEPQALSLPYVVGAETFHVYAHAGEAHFYPNDFRLHRRWNMPLWIPTKVVEVTSAQKEDNSGEPPELRVLRKPRLLLPDHWIVTSIHDQNTMGE
ncbi:MAG: M56 family metallopeptidase [Planctomycetaceae bacterium]